MTDKNLSSSVSGPSPELRARRAAYALLAGLWLAPPDAELAATLRELPGFAEHIPSGDLASWQNNLAVEHERLLGRNVYPYESIFRDRDLMLNTAAADRVAALYRDCDFDAGVGPGGAPDNLGLELRLMADLIEREEQARSGGDSAEVRWSQRQQARCLHEHLAQWAPVCAQAVGRVAREPVYSSLAALTAELIGSELAVVPADAFVAPIPLATKASGHQELEDSAKRGEPSDEDERGIGQVARRLLTPAEVGVLLCRDEIAALGRALQLPVPMGDRVQMLRGLFEAAGQFEQIPALLATLDHVFAGAERDITALVGEYAVWAPYGEAWRARIAAGRALLAELRAQASHPAGENT